MGWFARRGSPAMVVAGLAAALALLAPTAGATTAEGSGEPSAQEQVTTLQRHWDREAETANPVKGPEPDRAAKSQAPVLKSRLLAAAAPDECFAGVGEPYPAGTYDAEGNLVCPEGSQTKVNQAYVWGLTKTGDDLWFGTGPNIVCLVFSSYLRSTSPVINDSWVCEGEASSFRTSWTPGVTLPPTLGDWRPADLFRYDQATGTLTELAIPDTDPAGKARLSSTIGIRSAGSIGDRVFFAGPGMGSYLNVFVFDTDGGYVGSESLPGFTNIRKWVEVDGHLYTGVRAGNGGQVLRYTGSTAADPFQYVSVGTVPSEPAEIAEHEGRLYVSTWPAADNASLYMSPPISDGAAGVLDTGSVWQQVWTAGDYEPDPVTAATYGGGALVSFQGQLYWGTMHVPFTAALGHTDVYGPWDSDAAELANALGSHRAISIFRGDGLDTASPTIELLYGSAALPVYDGQTWTLAPNNMGTLPLYGASGFGNFFNNYTWTMGVYRDDLYVGTMDWSYLLAKGAEGVLNLSDVPAPDDLYGADLWRFPDATSAARPERTDGVGNYASYGIRTMVADDEDGLFLGMANPMNLMTDTSDDRPEGGWQLLRLTPRR